MVFLLNKGWTMRRSILAMGLAFLLSFSAPLHAADLGMPVKAPPPVEAPPPVVDLWPLLLLIPIGVCAAVCFRHHKDVQCVSGGGCFET
jgi:hypothetical protein